jgi:hypothetical protein
MEEIQQPEQTPAETGAAATTIISEPFFKKHALPIIAGLLVVLVGVGIYAIIAVHSKPTQNPTIVKRDTMSIRFLVNDLGAIAEGVGFKDKLSDGGYVYEVITGIDTVKDKEGKTQIDTVAFQKGHYLMDTVKDVLNQPILDTIKNGKQVLIDSVTKKPEVKVRLKYRLVPAVRPHFEYRNPKNVEEIPLSIHLLPPHP